jgi:hypothetical protein
MIGSDDSPHTFDYGDYYKILPAIHNWSQDPERIGRGIAVGNEFEYVSNKNSEWMTTEQLHEWIKANRELIGNI